MKKRLQPFSSKGRRLISVALLSVFFAGEAIPAAPMLEVFAVPTESRVPVSFYDADNDDLWEKIEARGDVLVTFPSQIHSLISSPEDVDVFNFTLEDTTDLALTLDSSSPCRIILSRNGVPVRESGLPHDQNIEISGLTAGSYALAVSPQSGTDYADYELNILRQTAKDRIPDYSEAHIAGITFNKRSPYRWRDLEDDNLDDGGHLFEIINYLAHWQGPVKDSVAPYYKKGDYRETPSDYVKYVDAEKTSREYHIPNVYLLPTNDIEGYREHWKNAILTYGAIDSGFAWTAPSERREANYSYVSEEYDGTLYRHGTTIVGWDDSIKKEHFTIHSGSDAQTPMEDGAWICKDSYGTNPKILLLSFTLII